MKQTLFSFLMVASFAASAQAPQNVNTTAINATKAQTNNGTGGPVPNAPAPAPISTTWNITGNSSTTASNYLGTSDEQPLRFRIKGGSAGIIDSALANTALGVGSLRKNTFGAANTAIGRNALANNTIGYGNVAIGIAAMEFNSTDHSSVAIGDSALNGVGYILGGFGYPLFGGNTAVGTRALFSTGSSHGFQNTAVGYEALYSSNAQQNTALGYFALHANYQGTSNTAVGVSSLSGNVVGSSNTAIGNNALMGNVNGNNNTAVGTGANVSLANLSNVTVIGFGALATASGQVRIGNNAVSSIGGYQPWTNFSDGRFKKNIQENVPGLAFINKLRPVTYNLDVSGINQHLKNISSLWQNENTTGQHLAENTSFAKTVAYTEAQPANTWALESKLATGFVAQEVEKAAKEVGYNFDGVDAPKNSNDFYGLRYSEFVVPLVKAVQELSEQNNKKAATISQLQAQLSAITARLQALETKLK